MQITEWEKLCEYVAKYGKSRLRLVISLIVSVNILSHNAIIKSSIAKTKDIKAREQKQ